MRIKRGDTIIEVIIAITIFCLVAIISITLMNSGVNTAEGALELTMARNEIDAQAEALRFIQNSFLSERELSENNQQFTKLWRHITTGSSDCHLTQASCGLAISPEVFADYSFSVDTCPDPDDLPPNAFVINTRFIEPSNFNFTIGSTPISYSSLLREMVISNSPDGPFRRTELYPRLVFKGTFTSDGTSDQTFTSDDLTETSLYRFVDRVEGIWIIAVRSREEKNQPQAFDFYVRTCWYRPGDTRPSTIGTIIRLYNPEVVE